RTCNKTFSDQSKICPPGENICYTKTWCDAFCSQRGKRVELGCAATCPKVKAGVEIKCCSTDNCNKFQFGKPR
uniref:Alpha-elapitoxin-Dpp2d n=2 Tax=Dendroaspis polylepis polylepis TaxID=8620 RepID=3L24_DENPO|nr:RecName: Full=Alpha-elapitoxin-Dpp2d; Short=Alpha-EPTX-Dpp2d [Dendroaspis polylepis polylepis]8DA0_E Chain E, Alpha-elapitoxin-Dpp2d [Dendroaspis polylepis polylepis]8DA0_F Chain F, Alpha-elapitoxin-Dpp2d [Dendroaspis polylepis polylepis]